MTSALGRTFAVANDRTAAHIGGLPIGLGALSETVAFTEAGKAEHRLFSSGSDRGQKARPGVSLLTSRRSSATDRCVVPAHLGSATFGRAPVVLVDVEDGDAIFIFGLILSRPLVRLVRRLFRFGRNRNFTRYEGYVGCGLLARASLPYSVGSGIASHDRRQLARARCMRLVLRITCSGALELFPRLVATRTGGRTNVWSANLWAAAQHTHQHQHSDHPTTIAHPAARCRAARMCRWGVNDSSPKHADGVIRRARTR